MNIKDISGQLHTFEKLKSLEQVVFVVLFYVLDKRETGMSRAKRWDNECDRLGCSLHKINHAAFYHLHVDC